MADIQYEEEQQPQFQSAAGQAEQKPFLVRLVLATGVVSTDKQAEYVLLGVAVCATILAFAIPLLMGGSSDTRVPPEKIQQIMGGTRQPQL